MMFIRTSISSSLEMCSANEERLALFRKREIHRKSVWRVLILSTELTSYSSGTGITYASARC